MTPTFVPERFVGRTAIVTGAGAGIGKATTLRLLAEGAAVIGADLRPERLEELTTEANSDALTVVAGDICDQSVVDSILAAAAGRADVLANIAGIMDGFLPTAEVDDSTWELVMNLNVTASMRLMRGVLPGMVERGAGSIVNVGSEASTRASAAGTAYTTSKHAVIGLTRSTAFFYTPKGVRVNAVCPGAVATSIEAPFKSQYAGERLGPIMGTTVPPVATAEQLAASITWLLSDDSANVSGAVLHSDGGWVAV